MSVLVIGADEVTSIKAVLHDLGASKVTHWDGRKQGFVNKKSIPIDTQCIVMLTTYLNHNTMKHFKQEAKVRQIPVICSKRSVSCVYSEYCKTFKLDSGFKCNGCKNK